MDFGSAGIKGNGKARAFEFPDGVDAEVALAGRARLRYNAFTNQLELSVSGNPYLPFTAGGGAIPLNGISWVDGRNGNDGTAIYGSQNNPFQTVQAAINSAIGSGFTTIGIVVLGGDYPEDVVVPNVLVDTRLGIVGLGGAGVNIRSLTASCPTGAGVRLDLSIESLTLGTRVGGGQTVAPLTLVGDNGNLEVETRGVNMNSSTPNIPPFQTLNAAATGNLDAVMGESILRATASPAAAVEMAFGDVEFRDITLRGLDTTQVLITGPCNFTGSDVVLLADGAGGNPLIAHSGPSGQINFVSSFCQPSSTTDDFIQVSSPATSVVLRSCIVGSNGYTGQVLLSGGPVFYNFVSSVDGNPVPIVGAGFETRFQNSSQVQHNSTTVIGTQPVDQAMDDLLFGTTQIGAPIVGPGTFALGDDSTILVDTGAAVTLTLPAITTRPRGKAYRIVDATGGGTPVTINPTGADTVNGGASLTFTPGGANASIVLQSESASTNWALTQADPTTGGGGGSTIPVDRITYVNQLNGNDATGVAGDIAFPFQTVQAAVNAAIATLGFSAGNLGIVVSPGSYLEDVDIDYTLSSGMYLGIYGDGHAVKIRSINVIGPNIPVGSPFFQELFIGDLCIGFPEGAGFSSRPALQVREGLAPLNVVLSNVGCFVANGNEDVVVIGPASTGGVTVEAVGGGAFANDNINAVTGRALVMDTGTFRGTGFNLQSRNAPAVEITGAAIYNDQGSRIAQVLGVGTDPLIRTTATTLHLISLNNTQLVPTTTTVDVIETNDINADITLNDVQVQLIGSSGNINMTSGGIVNVTSAYVSQTGPCPIIGATVVNLDHQGSQVGYSSSTVLGDRDMTDAVTQVVQGVSDTVARLTGGGAFAAGPEEVILVAEGASPTTITLPLRSTVVDGKKYRVVDALPAGSAGITIAASGADTINGGATFVMTTGPNNYVEVIAEVGAPSAWTIIGIRP